MLVRYKVTDEYGHVKGQTKELDAHIAKQVIAKGIAEQVDKADNLQKKEEPPAEPEQKKEFKTKKTKEK